MSSTEGSGGGEPLRLSKEPVEKPEIQRGHIDTVLMPGDVMHGGDIINGGCETVTFVTRSPCYRFRVTYHRVSILSFQPEHKQIKALIGPDTVVTWEKLDAQ